MNRSSRRKGAVCHCSSQHSLLGPSTFPPDKLCLACQTMILTGSLRPKGAVCVEHAAFRDSTWPRRQGGEANALQGLLPESMSWVDVNCKYATSQMFSVYDPDIKDFLMITPQSCITERRNKAASCRTCSTHTPSPEREQPRRQEAVVRESNYMSMHPAGQSENPSISPSPATEPGRNPTAETVPPEHIKAEKEGGDEYVDMAPYWGAGHWSPAPTPKPVTALKLKRQFVRRGCVAAVVTCRVISHTAHSKPIKHCIPQYAFVDEPKVGWQQTVGWEQAVKNG